MFPWEEGDTPDSLIEIRETLFGKVGRRAMVSTILGRAGGKSNLPAEAVLIGVYSNIALFKSTAKHYLDIETASICVNLASLYCGDALIKWI